MVRAAETKGVSNHDQHFGSEWGGWGGRGGEMRGREAHKRSEHDQGLDSWVELSYRTGVEQLGGGIWIPAGFMWTCME